MIFNYSKLKGRIVEKLGSNKKLAELIGLSEHSLSLKINNQVEFRQSEIFKICEVLDIDSNAIKDYFFECNVQSN